MRLSGAAPRCLRGRGMTDILACRLLLKLAEAGERDPGRLITYEPSGLMGPMSAATPAHGRNGIHAILLDLSRDNADDPRGSPNGWPHLAPCPNVALALCHCGQIIHRRAWGGGIG